MGLLVEDCGERRHEGFGFVFKVVATISAAASIKGFFETPNESAALFGFLYLFEVLLRLLEAPKACGEVTPRDFAFDLSHRAEGELQALRGGHLSLGHFGDRIENEVDVVARSIVGDFVVDFHICIWLELICRTSLGSGLLAAGEGLLLGFEVSVEDAVDVERPTF